MDKFNSVTNGTIKKLPPGFRFQPTDEELLFQYLKCKVLAWPLPASIIPEINVCKYEPWDLPGDWEQERYFFSNMEAKYPNGNRINRTTASGYWKATGQDKQIVSSSKNNNNVVGMKKTLVFHRGKPPHGSRTDWIMHEYRLVNSNTQDSGNQVEKWVLCRIFLRKRSVTNGDNEIIETCKNKNTNAVMNQIKFYDFMTRSERTVSASSSCSSCNSITDLSSSGECHEESSSYTFF